MKLIVGNLLTQAVIGGSDNLLPVDIRAELYDYLKVRADNYSRSPAYKRRQWDGYRRFLTAKNTFMTGFLPMVIPFLEDLLGETPEIIDERTNVPRLVDDLDNFIGRINGVDWRAEGKYAYQMDAVAAVRNYLKCGLYFPRGVIDAATNAGKNSIAALVIKNLEDQNTKVLFTVSNKEIYDQAVDFLGQALEERIGEVRSGKADLRRVTVAMVKTLLNRAKDSTDVSTHLAETGLVVVDESDEAGAAEYSKLLSYVGAGMRLHISGTPFDSKKVNNMIAVGLSGKTLFKVSNEELISKGVSQRPKIHMLLSNNPIGFKYAYEVELEKYVHLNEARAQMIVDLLDKHSDKQCLVTFVHKQHGHFMYDYCKERLPNIDMGLVYGDSAYRKETIEGFKKGRISVLFSSMILKRGVNIPGIQVLIMAHSQKSVATNKQLLGRALRHDGQSDTVLVYDFFDVGKYIGDHAKKRVTLYLKEGFEITADYEHKRFTPKL